MLSPERLRSLQTEEPSRLISMIRLIWPDIKSARSKGHTLKLIHQRIVESGIRISYSLFRLYVSRLRREESAQAVRKERFGSKQGETPIQRNRHEMMVRDPLANYRERCIENRPPTFDYDGDIPDKNRLI